MRPHSLLMLAAVAPCAGCVVTATPDGDGVYSGALASVTFAWTFNGGEDCATAGVDEVQVTVAGVSSTFPCSSWANGGASGTVDGVPAGSQQPFSLIGLSDDYDSSTGAFLGTTTETYQVSGNIDVLAGADNQPSGPVDLASLTSGGSASPPTASVIGVFWTFAGQSCAQAGVSSVQLAIADPNNPSNSTSQTVPCTQTNGGMGDGAGIGGWGAGTYTFTVSASGGAGSFFGSGSVSVNGTTNAFVSVDLGLQSSTTPPPAGPGTLSLDFRFGSGGQDCASAGLDHVHVFLSDGHGALVAGDDTTPACAALPVIFSGLAAPATYFVNAAGLAGTSTRYELTQVEVSVYPGTTSSYTMNAAATPGL